MTKKMKFSVADDKKKKATFKKRKNEMMKQLDEIVNICNVKACAVVYNPFNSITEAWPSREGVEELASKFMELSLKEQIKKMVDEEAFLRQRIAKEEAELQKLRDENREFQMKNIMWGCAKGEIDVRQLCERDLLELGPFINKYLNQITRRIDNLTEKGESSSSSPLVVDDEETNCQATSSTTADDASAPKSH